MRRTSGLLASALLAVALGVSCGGGGSLPAQAVCVPATPTAASGPGQSGAGLGFRYFRTVQDGTNRLNRLLVDFRTTYPDRTFYRSSNFRTDWVKYADSANCTIASLNAVVAPANAPQRYRELDASLRATLKEYTDVLASGRDAVTQRNTSGYRDWWDATDELEARIAAALVAAQN